MWRREKLIQMLKQEANVIWEDDDKMEGLGKHLRVCQQHMVGVDWGFKGFSSKTHITSSSPSNLIVYSNTFTLLSSFLEAPFPAVNCVIFFEYGMGIVSGFPFPKSHSNVFFIIVLHGNGNA